MEEIAQSQQQKKHWKEVAIERSASITDAWEVTKVVTGRLAEWILFGCMIANIVGILPGVSLPPLVTNIVMGIQIVTLDIAGFGLATMAENARANGAQKAANEATATAYLLIGIMMLTLVLFTLGIMVPTLKPFTSIAENVLILVRVGMIVLYGHVVHSLRRVEAATHLPKSQMEMLTDQFAQQLETLSKTFDQQVHLFAQQLTQLEQSIQQRLDASTDEVAMKFQDHLATELTTIHTNIQQSQETLAVVPRLQVHIQRIESSTAESLLHTKASLERQIQAMQGVETVPQRRVERSILRALPSIQKNKSDAGESKMLHTQDTHPTPPQVMEGKFDTRAFVFACLEENTALKLTDIQKLARAKKQELSEATISRYRKQFFASYESSIERNDESSFVKDARSPTSSIGENESPSIEKNARFVGENERVTPDENVAANE